VVAESVVEIARDELRLEIGGIDKQKWDELAAPIEAKHAAPWATRPWQLIWARFTNAGFLA